MAGPEKDTGSRFVILVTHINMALYSTCFWIQTGVMPYLSKRLGMDMVMFGYLQTTFAIIQLLGGPLFGRFGDLFGGRAALSLAYLSSGFTYLLMGLSTTVPLLFLSRLPSVFMHGMQAAQMVMTDLSSESERVGALGKLGLSYSVGMIIGSTTGGLLISGFGEPFAAYAAAAGSVLNTVVVMKYIPAHTKPVTSTKENKPAHSRSIFSVKEILRLLSIPGVAGILAIKTITGLPMGVFQSMFSVVAMGHFKLEAEHNGYLMAYIGALQMVMQGLVVGWLTQRIAERTLLFWSILLICLVGLATALMTNIVQFCLVCIPMCLGISVFYLTTNSILTKIVPPTDTGAMLGLNMCVHSLIRSVSPTIGGFLFESYGFSSFGYMQFLINLLVSLYVLGHSAN
ncbi:solute carrier family 22 member 18 isoform X2 [Carcharodon carcharias]|uniref:solute carrier family 22 member 18 isoform X2 n=1 Tax=Carcharodon carcharias TaxID=13397 RepID=UPI001B7DF87C|nr:solute carrier family 22 member 18 isoform X2 [Carcharodon carcharias]